MAKQAGTLVTFRVEDELKEQFVRAAEQNHQSTSQALRDLVTQYVVDARQKEIARQVANINANSDDEEEAMRFIAALSIDTDDGD